MGLRRGSGFRRTLAGMDFNDFSQLPPHNSSSQSLGQLPPLAPARGRPVRAIIGIARAVMRCIGRLVVVGLVVLFFVGVSHYGSNK
jgi:hypothetical protein